MNTICQHCGSPMQSQRATRKYCSEQCKQQAFYLRSGLQLSTAMNVSVQDIPGEDEGEKQDRYTAPTADILPALPTPEPRYQPEFSALIDMIIDYTDNSTAHDLFRHPEKYWSLMGGENVAWVNLRWRSILELLLKYASLSSVKAAQLIAVTTALRQMQQATTFRYMPSNYPFTKEIRELTDRMDAITASMKPKDSIKYRLTLPRKAIMIGMRFLLAGAVAWIPFDQLSFDK